MKTEYYDIETAYSLRMAAIGARKILIRSAFGDWRHAYPAEVVALVAQKPDETKISSLNVIAKLTMNGHDADMLHVVTLGE